MNAMSSPFKSSVGEAQYAAAYAASMNRWPVPYEDVYVRSRFGSTHVVASGHRDAPPLMLLHGFLVSATMWSPNIAALTKNYRVYAVDVMGQPSKSVPTEPIGSRADFVEWLTAAMDALELDRIYLAGYSYGGWLTLNYAMSKPERVKKIVVLSPAGSFLPNVTQFTLRGMSLAFFPRRFLVDRFMRWLTLKENLRDHDVRALSDCLVNQMDLGLKHFRMAAETLRVGPAPFSDEELRGVQVPTLLLIGDHEVLYDPAAALDRARRLIPSLEGQLVWRASHDMPYSQHQVVDARVLEFLNHSPSSEGSATATHTTAA